MHELIYHGCTSPPVKSFLFDISARQIRFIYLLATINRPPLCMKKDDKVSKTQKGQYGSKVADIRI